MATLPPFRKTAKPAPPQMHPSQRRFKARGWVFAVARLAGWVLRWPDWPAGFCGGPARLGFAVPRLGFAVARSGWVFAAICGGPTRLGFAMEVCACERKTKKAHVPRHYQESQLDATAHHRAAPIPTTTITRGCQGSRVAVCEGGAHEFACLLDTNQLAPARDALTERAHGQRQCASARGVVNAPRTAVDADRVIGDLPLVHQRHDEEAFHLLK